MFEFERFSACVCVFAHVCLVLLRCVREYTPSLMFGIGFIKQLVFRGMRFLKGFSEKECFCVHVCECVCV